MKKVIFFIIAIICFVAVNTTSISAQRNRKNAEPHHKVYVNDKRIADKIVRLLESRYRIRIADGDYWYDKISGLWGYVGGGTEGVIPAGWNLGGKLKEDVSDGNTGVFINGRELTNSEVTYLRNLVGRINRGRYWLNDKGFAGFVGQRALVNLYQASRRKKSGSLYRNFYTGTGSGGSGKDFYVIGKDWSY